MRYLWLGWLHRIAALKELGFTLAQVAELPAGGIETTELRGRLRLRQAELLARSS